MFDFHFSSCSVEAVARALMINVFFLLGFFTVDRLLYLPIQKHYNYNHSDTNVHVHSVI